MNNARAILKAINRRIRKARIFGGYNTFGVDYATWAITYPQMAMVFQEAAETYLERKGRFMPRFK